MEFIHPLIRITTKILCRGVKFIIIIAFQEHCLSLCENLYGASKVLSECEVFQGLYG